MCLHIIFFVGVCNAQILAGSARQDLSVVDAAAQGLQNYESAQNFEGICGKHLMSIDWKDSE